MLLKSQKINLAGIVVDLVGHDEAINRIIHHANTEVGNSWHSVKPLSVVSANLDHVIQFGNGGRWQKVIGDSLHPTRPLRTDDEGHMPVQTTQNMSWLTLLDGAPLVARANSLSGLVWPRLAGSDLINPLLDEAERHNLRVGFLGGQPHVQQNLARKLELTRPGLHVSGFWAPERSQLQDVKFSDDLAAQIKEKNTDILVVGLGKPRQELWMATYGAQTGASVLLAFGAVVDFLAGAVKRAPEFVSSSGLEWAWRLALEPRRLGMRYLVNDPPGLYKLQRDSVLLAEPDSPPLEKQTRISKIHRPMEPGRFVTANQHAEICVVAVTYNSADSVDALVASLREEAKTLALRVIIADNNSADATVLRLRVHEDIHVVQTNANLGYAGGINAATSLRGDCNAVLVLNPDLSVAPGSVSHMLNRMRSSGAGIVVPKLLQEDGSVYESLRREPNLLRAAGDALLGARLKQRPGWASEMEYEAESYAHAHPVDWATGAALLIDSTLQQKLGAWDEQFFLYSEETDYFRRAREAGGSIWFEPQAVMTHQMGGSGSSTSLEALMAVNRIRYIRKHRSARYSNVFQSLVTLHQALRCWKRDNRGILSLVAKESRWPELPQASFAGPLQ